MRIHHHALALGLALLGGCGGASAPTAQDATAFIEEAETRANDLWLEMAQAQWIAANFITEDSEAVSAAATAWASAASHRTRRREAAAGWRRKKPPLRIRAAERGTPGAGARTPRAGQEGR